MLWTLVTALVLIVLIYAANRLADGMKARVPAENVRIVAILAATAALAFLIVIGYVHAETRCMAARTPPEYVQQVRDTCFKIYGATDAGARCEQDGWRIGPREQVQVPGCADPLTTHWVHAERVTR